MGFFSGYGTIGKIYSQLKVIESDLIEMRRCLENPRLRFSFNSAASNGTKHLQDLVSLVDSSNTTVQSADFEFAEKKLPIRAHLLMIA